MDPLPHEEARVVARGHDRFVDGGQVADPPDRLFGVLDPDLPGLVALAPADPRVAAGLDDVVGEAAGDEQVRGRVDGVALGDRPEPDLHARPGQGHGLAGLVELDRPPVDLGQLGGDGLGRGRLGPGPKRPQLADRVEADVEQALGVGRDRLRVGEDLEQLGRDLDRLAVAAVDPGQVAGRLPLRGDRLEPGDLGHRVGDRLAGRERIAVGSDPDVDRHPRAHQLGLGEDGPVGADELGGLGRAPLGGLAGGRLGRALAARLGLGRLAREAGAREQGEPERRPG